jgi:hypothetical protein
MAGDGGRRVGGGGPWRRYAGTPRRDLRDQLCLRIGWIRFWLRGTALGFAAWLFSASFSFWPELRFLAAPFFWAGLILMPACALLALLSWVAPLPFERPAACPACGGEERVLSLPVRLEFTCRRCGRHGTILRGVPSLPAPAGPGR